MFAELLILVPVVVVGLAAIAWFAIRQRQMQLWLPSYLWPQPEDLAARHDIARRVRSALAIPRTIENATSPTERASVETGLCNTSETSVVQKPENHRGKLGGVGGNVLRVRSQSQAEPVDVFLAICDHYEPRCYGASHDTAIARVDRWCAEYPSLFGRFRDSGGRTPKHTFFFPQDEYHSEYLDRLAELCAEGWGDVDIHLHHDGDTAESLREKLESFRDTLFHRHGLLRRDPVTGEIIYGFIHGNWALCNCRPDGRWCGVDQELTVLRETGCYADFTLPSAPTDTQTCTINSIYYATDIPGQRKSHDAGVRARVGQVSPREHLLMVQGPLELDWSRRKFGLIPRIENADIHAGFAPTWQRLQLWLKAGVHVAGQPNWLFVKLHTHGCKEGNIDTLLGEPMVRFHEDLSRVAAEHPNFRFHYVTAWEMAQLVHAAEKKQDWQSVLSPAERRQPMAESR